MLTPLGRALDGWAPAERGKLDPVAAIGAAWSEIAGEDVARNSHPVAMLGTALVIVTRSSAWSQQLSFLAPRLIEAVGKRFPKAGIDRLRFRIGRVATASAPAARGAAARPSRRPAAPRPPAETVDEALRRFASEADTRRRAKLAAGWKECQGCSVPIAPDAGLRCPSCANAFASERERRIAQLLFEAPWLEFAGIADLVDNLGKLEYESVRRRLLARWWDTLARAQRAGRLSRDGRERAIASSYVILKSGLAPERIAPATVRAVLGDAVCDLIYGTEQH